MSEMQTLAPASSNLDEKYFHHHSQYVVNVPGSESLAKTLSPPSDDADFVPDVHSCVSSSSVLAISLTD